MQLENARTSPADKRNKPLAKKGEKGHFLTVNSRFLDLISSLLAFVPLFFSLFPFFSFTLFFLCPARAGSESPRSKSSAKVEERTTRINTNDTLNRRAEPQDEYRVSSFDYAAEFCRCRWPQKPEKAVSALTPRLDPWPYLYPYISRKIKIFGLIYQRH